ncbi:MAG: hypothetical protein GC172_06220 [Phycisphaera sp.]|nr:hypothetical protein [Phycisphaera sp.]
MKPHAHTPTLLAAAATALALVLVPVGAVRAQGTSQPGTPPPAAAPGAGSGAAKGAGSGTAPSAPSGTEVLGFRLPLLREGSMVNRVHGDITLDPGERHWLFRPLKPEAGNLRREFVLLPSPTLEEMLRTMQLSPSPVEFEVSGRVFIYKGRNYLLPEFAPPIVRFDVKPGETPPANAAVETAPNGASKFVPAAGAAGDGGAADADDAAVIDLEKRLVERVGRAPAERLTESLESREARLAKERELPAPGARIVLRAGKISRDPQTGSWRFVPEQASGVGDGSVEILPCLMLERLELATRESDAPPMVLLSGTLTVFEGRTYLLPTSFRRAREGRGIGP